MPESTPLLAAIASPRDLKALAPETLPHLADELRQEILDTVSRTGGHMGSNLGVVELTIALHRVFDFATDRLVWDVSHQAYAHKLLTGRRDRFGTLRQGGGLSGFTNRDESPYDVFTSGHAGAAISTALGIVVGDEAVGRTRAVVAVVGDGAMTAGVAFEALNHAGHVGKPLLVILNDNEMSIARTVGAISGHLARIRVNPRYIDVKRELHGILERHFPRLGPKVESGLEQARGALRRVLGGYLFEEFGFYYVGPFNGHDIPEMITALTEARRLGRPVLMHVVTEKGRGYPNVEQDPLRAHGVGPGKAPVAAAPAKVEGAEGQEPTVAAATPTATPTKKAPAYTDVFAEEVLALAADDPRILAITAAMPDGTGLLRFAERYPSRFFDVGICEQHAVALAAGMATAGARPVAAIYSTFLQRAVDQVFHEVALQGNVPVLFAVDRAGLVGADGPTHHGLFDIAYLRTFPNMTLMAPKDGDELRAMVRFALTLPGPAALRYPRTNVPQEASWGSAGAPMALGKAEVLCEGNDGAIMAYGAMVAEAQVAVRMLAEKGVRVTLVNGRFAKPVDGALLAKLLAVQPFVLTVEEHARAGGFGSAILEEASARGCNAGKIRVLAVPDRFMPHADRAVLMHDAGIDAAAIVAAVEALQKTKI